MQRWKRYLGLINILLTILVMAGVLFNVQHIYQRLVDLDTIPVLNKQIVSLLTTSTVIGTGIALLIKYNVYKVVFSLYLVEIPGKILYFYQLLMELVGACVSAVIPVEWSQVFWEKMVILIVSLLSVVGLLALLGRYVWQFPTEVDSKKRFLTASGVILLLHMVFVMIRVWRS